MANLEFDIREKILHTSTNLQVCLQCQYQLTQSWWRISRRGTISRFIMFISTDDSDFSPVR